MVNGPLQELLDALRESPGVARKADIGPWARRFAERARSSADILGPGDDAGAVGLDDGFLLVSAEGIWPPLLQDPEFAGFCAVSVNVNDIRAMGGWPLGLVAVVFEGDVTAAAREKFLDGLESGLDHYGLPLLGGHTSREGACLSVAVCIAGRARRLLRGDGARPGHAILAALDLEGEQHQPFHAWDSVRGADPSATRRKLEVLATISERELALACRDISNPGLLGTLAMMLEASGAGAVVDLDAVPAPESVDEAWWLAAYPSYGFLLAVRDENVDSVISLFASRDVACAKIGRVRDGSSIAVTRRGESGVFIDWRQHPVTGIF